MSDLAAALQPDAAARSRDRRVWVEAAAAGLLFLAFAVAVLARPPQILEPDDVAYRGSIFALAHGDVTLTTEQLQQLAAEIAAADPEQGFGGFPGGPQVQPGQGGLGSGPFGGGAIAQWVQLPSGEWISEKNPGYPYLALPFHAVGLERLAPLFYGALACLALFVGARRWLGPWAGVWAVAAFLANGAALVFAWRAWMPTFTDTSLIAVGAALLLWSLVAGASTVRCRTVAGSLAFLALALAVACRYTNVVAAVVAAVAALLLVRRAGLPWRTLAWWLGTAAVVAAGVAAFGLHYYGDAVGTGYQSGVITFSLESVLPNLRGMPPALVRAMPVAVIAAVSIAWAVGRRILRSDDAAARRDLPAVLALAAAWLGLWGLYLAYDWTVRMGAGGGVHTVRFYVEALGPMALLAAWGLTRVPRWLAVLLVAALIGLAAASFAQLADGGLGGPGGGRPEGGRSGVMPTGAPGAPGGPGGPAAPGGQPPGAPAGR